MGGGTAAESELFTWPSAQLFLVEGGGGGSGSAGASDQCRVLMQSGVFSLLLTKHSRFPHLALVEAAVSELRWPVGKDSLVTLLDSSTHAPLAAPTAVRFLFAFPAPHEQLLYEVQLLQQKCSASLHDNDEAEICRLKSLLRFYASLRQHDDSNCIAAHAGLSSSAATTELEVEAAGKYWERVAAASRNGNGKLNVPEIHCGNKEKQGLSDVSIGLQRAGNGAHRQTSCSSRSCTTSTGSTATSLGGVVSKGTMKKMQKARRVSAVAKLFSKAMARGLISGAAHVVQEGEGPDVAATATIAGMQSKLSTREKMRPAVAKVEAITRLVEAVERGGAAAAEDDQYGSEGLQNEDQEVDHKKMKSNSTARIITSQSSLVEMSANLATWTLNKVGMQLLINVVVAANYMQSGSESLTSTSASSNYSMSSSSCSLTSLHNIMGSTSALQHRGSSSTPASSRGRPASRLHRPPRPAARPSHFLNEATSPLLLNSSPTLGQS